MNLSKNSLVTDHWVINASPLILLGKAGQLDWLPELGPVVIPAAVVEEIKAGSPEDPARKFVESTTAAPCFKEARVGDEVTAWDLGAGESAVISWAIENPGYAITHQPSHTRQNYPEMAPTVNATDSPQKRHVRLQPVTRPNPNNPPGGALKPTEPLQLLL